MLPLDHLTIPVMPVNSVSGYVQRVVDISNAMQLVYGSLWFRGISKSNLRLLPGVVWRHASDEDSILQEFMVSLPAYHAKSHDDPWELYSLMQHFGLPTRLLDWSKAPLAALFFALDFDDSKASSEHFPVVWAMNPYELNRLATSEPELYVPTSKFGFSAHADMVDSYLPKSIRPFRISPSTALPPQPLAIEPPFSNPRVLAQQGCFTVHGRDTTPLDEIIEMNEHLLRINIAPEAVVEMRADLAQLGFRAEWIYQDLDRLSRRIIAERC